MNSHVQDVEVPLEPPGRRKSLGTSLMSHLGGLRYSRAYNKTLEQGHGGACLDMTPCGVAVRSMAHALPEMFQVRTVMCRRMLNSPPATGVESRRCTAWEVGGLAV